MKLRRDTFPISIIDSLWAWMKAEPHSSTGSTSLLRWVGGSDAEHTSVMSTCHHSWAFSQSTHLCQLLGHACIHIRKSDTFRILNSLPERLGQVQWAHRLSMASQQSSLHVGKSQWVCGSMVLEQQEWDMMPLRVTGLKSLASLLTHRPSGISVAFSRVQGISPFSFPCRDHQEGLATCHLAPCLLAGRLECDIHSSGLHTGWLSDPCDWCLTWTPRLGPQLCKETLGHLPSSLAVSSSPGSPLQEEVRWPYHGFALGWPHLRWSSLSTDPVLSSYENKAFRDFLSWQGWGSWAFHHTDPDWQGRMRGWRHLTLPISVETLPVPLSRGWSPSR